MEVGVKLRCLAFRPLSAVQLANLKRQQRKVCFFVRRTLPSLQPALGAGLSATKRTKKLKLSANAEQPGPSVSPDSFVVRRVKMVIDTLHPQIWKFLRADGGTLLF